MGHLIEMSFFYRFKHLIVQGKEIVMKHSQNTLHF